MPKLNPNRPKVSNPNVRQFAWRIKDWSTVTQLSEAYIYELMNGDHGEKLRTARIGGARRILEDPYEYMERHLEKDSNATEATANKTNDVLDLDLDIAV